MVFSIDFSVGISTSTSFGFSFIFSTGLSITFLSSDFSFGFSTRGSLGFSFTFSFGFTLISFSLTTVSILATMIAFSSSISVLSTIGFSGF